jgi:hypothetical protein
LQIGLGSLQDFLSKGQELLEEDLVLHALTLA